MHISCPALLNCPSSILIPLSPLVKLCNDTTIPHPINLQHEAQSRTPHHHLESEIEVVELDAPRRRQPRE